MFNRVFMYEKVQNCYLALILRVFFAPIPSIRENDYWPKEGFISIFVNLFDYYTVTI